MTEKQVFGFKLATRPEQVDDEHCERMQDCNHRLPISDDSASRCESSSDGIFGKDRENFRFVTSSRLRLRDLIPSRESRTSDFWNIFGTVLQLPTIDPSEFADFVQPMTKLGFEFDQSGQKEFFNWTAGVPVLAAAMCRGIMETIPAGPITKMQLDSVGDGLVETARDILADLWDDCSQELQGDLIDLNTKGDLGAAIPPRRREVLADRGYLIQNGGKVRANCRLMSRFATLNETRARDLRDFFLDRESEERNFKKILELKLSQIEGGDADLRSYINLAIQGLSQETRASLVLIRSIAESAVQLAWDAEFQNGVIPGNVQAELTRNRGTNSRGLDPALLGRTHELYARRTILRRAVGGGESQGPKLTKKVTRPLMLLIDHLHAVGNFGQHMNAIAERPVDFTFCVAACFAALALLKRTIEDLQ